MKNEIILEKTHPVGTRLMVGDLSMIVECTGKDALLKARREVASRPEGTPNRAEALKIIDLHCN